MGGPYTLHLCISHHVGFNKATKEIPFESLARKSSLICLRCTLLCKERGQKHLFGVRGEEEVVPRNQVLRLRTRCKSALENRAQQARAEGTPPSPHLGGICCSEDFHGRRDLTKMGPPKGGSPMLT